MKLKKVTKDSDCKTLYHSSSVDFENAVNKLLAEGYVINSSSCNSKGWIAIMIKK